MFVWQGVGLLEAAGVVVAGFFAGEEVADLAPAAKGSFLVLN